MDRVKGKPRLSTVERHFAQYLVDLHRRGIIFVGWREKENKRPAPRTLVYHHGKFGY